DVESQLRQIGVQKADVARLAQAASAHDDEIERIVSDQERVRSNMESLHGTAQERQLLQRYVKQLDEQETQLAALRKEAASLSEQQRKAQTELERLIERLVMG